MWECALNLNELEKKEEKRKKTSKEESEEKGLFIGILSNIVRFTSLKCYVSKKHRMLN